MSGYVGYAISVEPSPRFNFRVVHPVISAWIPLYDQSKKLQHSVFYYKDNVAVT